MLWDSWSEETAEYFLHKAFTGLLEAAADLGAKSFCCPSIGCGCRAFPVETVAHIGLGVFTSPPNAEIPYIEIRCTQREVLETWIEKTSEFGLERAGFWEWADSRSLHFLRVASPQGCRC